MLNDRQNKSGDEQAILDEVNVKLIDEVVANLALGQGQGEDPSAAAVRMARLKYLVTLVAWMAADGMMPVGAFVRQCFQNGKSIEGLPGRSAAFARVACETLQHVMLPILLTNLPAICASRDLARDTFRYLRMRLKKAPVRRLLRDLHAVG